MATTKKKAAPKRKPPPAAEQPKYRHQVEVETYIRAVMSGDIVVSKKVRLAVERHLKDLKRAEKSDCPYYFDGKRANAVISFMQLFYLDNKKRKPFILQPWQKCLVWVLFGWRQRSDHMRRFQYAYISMGRGGGKSPLAGLIKVTLALFDSPPIDDPECVIAATKRDQTKYVYDEITKFISQHRELADRCKISNRHIKIDAAGIINRLGAGGEDGGRYHSITIDELHEWTTKAHKDQYEKLRTGMGKLPQALMVIITTAGNERSKLWFEIYSYCDQVLRSVIEDDEWFIFIAEIDPEDDPFDERCWIKANPNMGVSCFPRTIRALARKARYNAVEKMHLLRYYCNVRVRSQAKIISRELWEFGAGPLPNLTGLDCCAGLDLGWTNDMTALALVFGLGAEDDPKRKYAIKCWAWIPESGGRNLLEEPIRTFIRKGWLKVVPGKSFDPDVLYEQLKVCQELYRVKAMAADKNNAQAILKYVEKHLQIPSYGFRQSYEKYHEPIKRSIDYLQAGRLLHGNNGLLGWFFDNVIVKTDATGHVMPDKEVSEEKIDGATATLMGFSEYLYRTDTTFNPYLKRGLRKL